MTVHKLGFPDIILPGDVRNDIYVTLESGVFEKGVKRSERNVEVAIEVIDGESKSIPVRDCCVECSDSLLFLSFLVVHSMNMLAYMCTQCIYVLHTCVHSIYMCCIHVYTVYICAAYMCTQYIYVLHTCVHSVYIYVLAYMCSQCIYELAYMCTRCIYASMHVYVYTCMSYIHIYVVCIYACMYIYICLCI